MRRGEGNRRQSQRARIQMTVTQRHRVTVPQALYRSKPAFPPLTGGDQTSTQGRAGRGSRV